LFRIEVVRSSASFRRNSIAFTHEIQASEKFHISALQILRYDKEAMSKTILYIFGFISLGLVSGSLGPTIPALAVKTHSQLNEISNLFLIRSFGTMTGAVLVGRFYDRISGHPLLAVSLLVSALAMALTPMAELLWVLLAVSAVLGFAGGSINVGGNALMVQVHGERSRPFMSALHFAFGLGGFLAPIFFTFFINHQKALEITYWTLAALAIPTALLILFTHSPQPKQSGNIAPAAFLPTTTLILFMLFFFLEVGAEASVMGWYYSYARERGVTESSAGWLNSGFWAAFTLGRLATIWLSLRFRAITVIVATICFGLLIAAVMCLLPPSPALLWVGSIGFGLAVAPIFPSAFAYAQRMAGLSGKLTAFFLVGSSSGGMFWPWLIGQFFKAQGPQLVVAVVLFDLLGALAVLFILHHRAAKSDTVEESTLSVLSEPETKAA
jgi:FHS family Na+ dependent glucose MFS transporter 1